MSNAFHLATQLQNVTMALHTLGMGNPAVPRAAALLISQDEEIKRLRSSDAYLAGHKEGMAQAFESGLVEDDPNEHDGRGPG